MSHVIKGLLAYIFFLFFLFNRAVEVVDCL